MTTLLSQNEFPALASDSPLLHTWVIPAKNGTIRIRLRNGSAGFLLAHFIMWFAETIQPVIGGTLDDWGWSAMRAIRGTIGTVSNHCSGTAVDLNAQQHPLGKRGTFRAWQYAKIRARLLLYAGCIRSGIDYQNRADEMHHEINRPLDACERRARRLASSPRGKRILHANPGQRAVIFS